MFHPKARPPWLTTGILLLVLVLLTPTLALSQLALWGADNEGNQSYQLDMGKNPAPGGGSNKPEDPGSSDPEEGDVPFTDQIRLDDLSYDFDNNIDHNFIRMTNGDYAGVWGGADKYYIAGQTIVFARSEDDGETWSQSIVISHVDELEITAIQNLDIAELADGAIGIVYNGLYWNGLTYWYNVYFQRSDDNGETWTDPVTMYITRDPSDELYDPYNPGLFCKIAATGDNVIILYQSSLFDMMGDLYCARSSDGGFSWIDTVQVNHDWYVGTAEPVWNPVLEEFAVVVDSGPVILMYRSSDYGATWHGGYQVTYSELYARYPVVAVDSEGTYHVAWCERPGYYDLIDIFHTSSDDGGLTWTDRIQVSPADSIEEANVDADIYIDGQDRVHVTWKQNLSVHYPDYAEYFYQAYYSYSDDGGESWAENPSRVNSEPDELREPPQVLANDEGNPIVFFGFLEFTDPFSIGLWYAHGTIEVGEDGSQTVSFINDDLSLRVAPNPFNPMTTIKFNLPKTSRVDLQVFDMRGHLVRTLVSGETLESGVQQVLWNGKNNAGMDASSGVYFYQVQADGLQQTNRMTLMR